MGWEDDDDEGAWRPPLPPEDRLWRHPSEIAAIRGVTVAATPPSNGRRLWGIAAASAVGGALAVGTLWLAIGSPTRTTVTNTTVAVQEIAMTPRLVSAPDWAAAVTDGIVPALTTVETAGGSGSAVLVRDDGTFVTASTVVGDVVRAVVHLPDGSAARATVVGADPSLGIAVLRVEAEGSTGMATAPVAVQDAVRRGDWIAAAGADAMPLAAAVEELSASTGVGADAVHGLLRLDVPVPEGALGGAVVDDTGALTALLVAADATSAYALPVADVMSVLDDLDRHGEIRRPWLGVEGADTGSGVRLDRVDPAGPGAVAGLAPGDVLTRVAGRPVTTAADLVLSLRPHRPGDTVTIEVRRGEATWTAEIILGRRPA
ncbi:MAG: S1C family serine protease [Acidimicrobiales bacterium]|nr:S1C family serine protease [Acidimicrobiales bacterium]